MRTVIKHRVLQSKCFISAVTLIIVLLLLLQNLLVQWLISPVASNVLLLACLGSVLATISLVQYLLSRAEPVNIPILSTTIKHLNTENSACKLLTTLQECKFPVGNENIKTVVTQHLFSSVVSAFEIGKTFYEFTKYCLAVF